MLGVDSNKLSVNLMIRTSNFDYYTPHTTIQHKVRNRRQVVQDLDLAAVQYWNV